jgi:hypothetical protein
VLSCLHCTGETAGPDVDMVFRDFLNFFAARVKNADSVQKTQIMQARNCREAGNKQHQQEKTGVFMIEVSPKTDMA